MCVAQAPWERGRSDAWQNEMLQVTTEAPSPRLPLRETAEEGAQVAFLEPLATAQEAEEVGS